ncbi:MAG: T9SS type A sorting domain-containing protein [Bacteroidia bacterium]
MKKFLLFVGIILTFTSYGQLTEIRSMDARSSVEFFNYPTHFNINEDIVFSVNDSFFRFNYSTNKLTLHEYVTNYSKRFNGNTIVWEGDSFLIGRFETGARLIDKFNITKSLNNEEYLLYGTSSNPATVLGENERFIFYEVIDPLKGSRVAIINKNNLANRIVNSNQQNISNSRLEKFYFRNNRLYVNTVETLSDASENKYSLISNGVKDLFADYFSNENLPIYQGNFCNINRNENAYVFNRKFDLSKEEYINTSNDSLPVSMYEHITNVEFFDDYIAFRLTSVDAARKNILTVYSQGNFKSFPEVDSIYAMYKTNENGLLLLKNRKDGYFDVYHFSLKTEKIQRLKGRPSSAQFSVKQEGGTTVIGSKDYTTNEETYAIYHDGISYNIRKPFQSFSFDIEVVEDNIIIKQDLGSKGQILVFSTIKENLTDLELPKHDLSSFNYFEDNIFINYSVDNGLGTLATYDYDKKRLVVAASTKLKKRSFSLYPNIRVEPIAFDGGYLMFEDLSSKYYPRLYLRKTEEWINLDEELDYFKINGKLYAYEAEGWILKIHKFTNGVPQLVFEQNFGSSVYFGKNGKYATLIYDNKTYRYNGDKMITISDKGSGEVIDKGMYFKVRDNSNNYYIYDSLGNQIGGKSITGTSNLIILGDTIIHYTGYSDGHIYSITYNGITKQLIKEQGNMFSLITLDEKSKLFGTTDGRIYSTKNELKLIKNYGSYRSDGYQTMNPYGILNGKLIFSAYSMAKGDVLYTLDLKTEEIEILKEFIAGKDDFQKNAYYCQYRGPLQGFRYIKAKNLIYFMATTPEFGSELFATDGTESKSGLLLDLNKGDFSSTPSNMVANNNFLYFTTTKKGFKTFYELNLGEYIPSVQFTGYCLEDEFTFLDSSTLFSNQIINSTWIVDSKDTLIGSNISYTFSDAGEHKIILISQASNDSGSYKFSINIPKPNTVGIQGETTTKKGEAYIYSASSTTELNSLSWFVEGGNIIDSSETSITVIWQNYPARVVLSGIDNKGCATIETEIQVEESLGLFDKYDENLQVFPNPAHEKIFINGNYDTFDFTIYNSLGEIVIIGSTTQNVIDLNNLKNGIYLMKIDTEFGSSLHQVIKK